MRVEIVLPVISEEGTYNGFEINQGVIDTILFNFQVNNKPIPVKIGHINANGEDKESELADGFLKSLFQKDGGLWAVAEIPEETWKYIQEGRLFATSPEILVKVSETGEKDYELVGLALLGNSQPAIPSNYIMHFSKYAPARIVEFRKVSKEVEYYSHFRKSDWGVDDVYLTTEWDKDKAMKEIVEEKGWETLARCCLAVQYKQGEDTSEFPEAYSRYKFPFAELRDGKLVINSKAVATAKAYLNGARGVNVAEELADVVEPLVEYLDELVQKAREKAKEKEMDEKLFKRITKTETSKLEVFEKVFRLYGLKIRRE